jgi:multisubunit Na+/H+ antiporter MnhB subunit
MAYRASTLGFTGIAVGALALLLVLIHFWAGPFSSPPPIEQVIAEKAAAIRDATVAALNGEDVKMRAPASSMNLDKALDIVASVLGAIALILGVLGFAKKESVRVAASAALLGTGAIAFQFAVLAIGQSSSQF